METENYQQVLAEVRMRLDVTDTLSDEKLEEIIDEVVLKQGRKLNLTAKGQVQLASHIFNSLRKMDILQPLLEDVTITEIMVNGKDQIFIEKNGALKKAEINFDSEERLEDLIQNIVSRINRVVNESSPICDARLPDGSRVHIVLPPVSLCGPTLTIRKFSNRAISMDDLIRWGTLTKEVAGFLEKTISDKHNIFISGGTNSGKTTLLNILSNFIPKDERIVTIEDSAELKIQGIENLVRLETRNANTEGKGTITIRELIRASLRMRPDRIIVGEVRGQEAIDMLQAMNTGHEGSLSTGHANSAKDMLSRLETMILTSENIPLMAIRHQIASAIDLLVHLGKDRDKKRKVMEIVRVSGVKEGEIQLETLYRYDEEKEAILNLSEW